MWVQEKECRGIIQESWHEGASRDLMDKLLLCYARLEEWGGGMLKEMRVKLSEHRKELQRYRSRRDADGFRRYNEEKHNSIKGLQDENGEWKDTEDEVQGIISRYFYDILSTRTTGESMPDRIKFARISEEQGDLPEDVNRTLACLIPKVKQLKRMVELRPISLCNVMMRIISKIMANRLKPCLHSIVSEKQSTFIEGRLLTDNALIAFEINNYIKSKMQGREGVGGLKKSEKLSGQVINYDKSEVIFSPNTRTEDRVLICECLGVKQTVKPGKYLGMPMCVGRNKTEVFGFLKDRVQAKLQGWGNKDLSKQEKLTLLKTAAQVIPSFWMNLFLIPVNMCEELERKMNAFLWGRGSTGKGVKWMAWKKLCRPKECGGLGVRDLRNFNLAMLAKQGWRLLNETNPLVSAIMKAKYYPQTDLLNTEAGANASYIWRSIMASLRAVKAGTRRKIGNGIDTNVWKMPWIPRLEDGYLTSAMQNYLGHITVNNLMVTGEKRWDLTMIKDIFYSHDVEEIKRIPLPLSDTRDS
ncbi:uncharacterized protein LOC141664942 [Apium graveolens]|uniref:uncharacterized protein LOC141664942 n=1 Tax=Apium graveolens TaxID=4045 RepID=UPI003D7BDDD4